MTWRDILWRLQLRASVALLAVAAAATLPPSDQTEEQARFECMRLARVGAISDAELLGLREQPMSWRAVLDRVNDGWAARVSAASLPAC
jgi:hypothetical protein